ncbi:hypothetical protein Purlil1_13708 [Purpureocillium lilacinum]|uniref:Uncharacterized protein n=1 Tax=Purpureocillium lilacinum TaxID=33203 RepID=A0ABR0BDC8_PURLI|nr:hypothetical protein Purlil1_13708 [Purpureocillium lilacinum]
MNATDTPSSVAMDPATSPSKRDRTGDNFSRATNRLLKRCHQISRRYDADVYVCVRRKHRAYDYNSTSDPKFPACVDLEKVYPPAVRRTPQDFGKEQEGQKDGSLAADMTGLARDDSYMMEMPQGQRPK